MIAEVPVGIFMKPRYKDPPGDNCVTEAFHISMEGLVDLTEIRIPGALNRDPTKL